MRAAFKISGAPQTKTHIGFTDIFGSTMICEAPLILGKSGIATAIVSIGREWCDFFAAANNPISMELIAGPVHKTICPAGIQF